jgi:hypothetical protein
MANEQAQSNTVMGHPERVFREAWLSLQWKAMARTGKGYRRPPQPTHREAQRDKELEKANGKTETR